MACIINVYSHCVPVNNPSHNACQRMSFHHNQAASHHKVKRGIMKDKLAGNVHTSSTAPASPLLTI